MPENVPDGSIVITPKEFYDGVKADVGAIKDAVGALRADLNGIPTRVDRLEARVQRLEARVVWLAGFAAGAGATVGSLVSRYLGG